MIDQGVRRGMVLYSGKDCIYSHVCRMMIKEKDVDCEWLFPEDDASQENRLGEINPYLETPTLLDRDLVLYDVSLIAEYLDERLPYPPLMSADPVGRGRIRLMMHRIRRDWLDALYKPGGYADVDEEQSRLIREGLISISHILRGQQWLMGDDYSLADVFMAALLWRRKVLSISLPKSASPVLSYAARLFDRPAFGASLTAVERTLAKS